MIADIENLVCANGRFIDQKPAYKKMLNYGVALQLDERVVPG